jgi:hypothetical protein
MGVIADLLNVGGQAAAAYLPYEAAGQTMTDLQNAAAQYTTGAQQLGQTASAPVQFTPFSVRTPSSTMNVTEGGGYDVTLGGPQQAIQAGLLGQAQAAAGAGIDPTAYQQLSQQAMAGAQGYLGQPTASAADIYSQMQAAQAAQQERQRLEMENRLAGQGRLGVGTAMYGGTPEQLAMEKAFAEQGMNNWMQAQTLAPQLAAQQTANASALFGLGSQAAMSPYQQQAANLQNITGALGAAYVPEQQALAALSPAAQFANIQQSGNIAESEALYKSGIAGLQGQAEAQKAISNLESARVSALADALGGLFTGSGTADSPVTAILNKIGL